MIVTRPRTAAEAARRALSSGYPWVGLPWQSCGECGNKTLSLRPAGFLAELLKKPVKSEMRNRDVAGRLLGIRVLVKELPPNLKRLLEMPESAIGVGVGVVGLSRASAVVMDVSNLNPNIVWELQTVKELLPPEMVILVCATGEKGALIDGTILDGRLEEDFGKGWLSRTRKVTYKIPGAGLPVIGGLLRKLRDFQPILFANSREFCTDCSTPSGRRAR